MKPAENNKKHRGYVEVYQCTLSVFIHYLFIIHSLFICFMLFCRRCDMSAIREEKRREAERTQAREREHRESRERAQREQREESRERGQRESRENGQKVKLWGVSSYMRILHSFYRHAYAIGIVCCTTCAYSIQWSLFLWCFCLCALTHIFPNILLWNVLLEADSDSLSLIIINDKLYSDDTVYLDTKM